MRLTEVLKKSFLEGYGSVNIDFSTIVMCMLITVLVAMYIFMIYRLLNRSAFYNRNFNLALIALAVITAAVILTIQSNIVISLGMVGALSIVRFRTAVKDPMDLVFLFWSISAGIITVIILLCDRMPVGRAAVILLVNSSDYRTEPQIMEIVEKRCENSRVKARNLTKDRLNMAIEVRTQEGGKLVEQLMELDSVISASLMDHDGEVTF